MPVSCDCFLMIARESVNNSGEQWTRNAISRAYYFMYHSALEMVGGRVPNADKNGNRFSHGSHKRLSEYLCSGDAATDHNIDKIIAERIGMRLKAAHQKRCFADYEISRHIKRIEALSMITAAEELASVLGNVKT